MEVKHFNKLQLKFIKPILAVLVLACGIIIMFLIVGSCSKTGKKKVEIVPNAKSPIIKKPGSSFNDTLVINANSAVFYSPDPRQMKKIKSVNDKEIYDLLIHNCHYQMENARVVLKTTWPQIKMVETSKIRFLLFEKINKSKVCIDLNDKNDICGLFLFDGKKDPALVDMPNVDTQLGRYFSN